MTCARFGCTWKAKAVLSWPWDAPVALCWFHADRARAVGNALGLDYLVEPLVLILPIDSAAEPAGGGGEAAGGKAK